MTLSDTVKHAGTFQIARALCLNPQILKARPSVNWFLCQYLRKFDVIDVAGNLVVHSHLPPLNSLAYRRFVNEHLLDRSVKPSHAQIGITNLCPQDCSYCYNKGRTGEVMETETILRVIRDLKSLGVFWIGLTGGEPLLNKDITTIVEEIGTDCTSKLFTTGCGLTQERAHDLQEAGLTYVTISLDHWKEEEHDKARNYKGAYRIALRAVETFKRLDTMHVSVSAVLSKQMIQRGEVEEFLEFLRRLGIHEAWLSETKPSVQAYWNTDLQITDEERLGLIRLQDRCNAQGGMTVNYLSHFEDKQNFGCTAGHKMIYIDAFGEVSPCVFIPMTFGNVQKTPVLKILKRMQSVFPSEDRCFINTHYQTIREHFHGHSPIAEADSMKILSEVRFGPLARFFKLQYK